MVCNKCNKENLESDKFCSFCGNNLSNNLLKQNSIHKTLKKDNIGKTSVLSWISLGVLIFQVLIFLLFFVAPLENNNIILDIAFIPWAIISLILAIISRVLYKDKMSIPLIVISSIIILLEIIFIVIFVFLAGYAIIGCLSELPKFVDALQGCS